MFSEHSKHFKYAFILGRTQNVRLNEHDEIEYADRYLIFKLIAARGKAPKITSFKHRLGKVTIWRLLKILISQNQYPLLP